MTNEQILNAIADACDNDTLRFQLILQDKILHVYINRPTQAELEYHNLKSKIYGVITEKFYGEFTAIWLYCRVLGKVEADWQAVLEIETASLDPAQVSSMMQAITGAVEATNSIIDKINLELEIPESFAVDWYDFEELPTTAGENSAESDLELLESIDRAVLELDLNKYCFISNQRLLYAILTAPKENIARLVDTFDRFEQSTKRSQLPVLEIYFNQSINPDLATLEPGVQIWWREIVILDLDQQRQLAIWLSRYCLHPEQTISIISKVFTPQIEEKQKRSQATINAIRQKLSRQSLKQNQNNTQAKPGLFASWRMWLDKFLRNS
ncbi:MAG: hypothetical protein RLZZ74_2937 [Cyanobacteriota bacterium]|jgi:hypothetical protein